MNRFNTPTTPAFLNDFTAEFLVKDADTPDGFHLFESGTGKYTILFPEDYVVEKSSYYRKKASGSGDPDTENVYLDKMGVSPKENQMIQGVKLFLHPDVSTVDDIRLDMIRDKLNAPDDIEFTEEKLKDNTIYYIEYIDEYKEDDMVDTYYYLYGLISDNNSKQAIFFELEDTCFNSNTLGCSINFEAEKKLGTKMMESIKFK
ncbi:hypothetical protein [Paucisalibacillus globulus]|uniref:hypothetical protein n=1 Tax=Paucisalibacillus globulus TaxID=351095 RepID=UPI00040E098C|nr:hypothetical protein [Paucisalibacillus globulus]